MISNETGIKKRSSNATLDNLSNLFKYATP